MLAQTIDQVKPLLLLLQQPAFCVRKDGRIECNGAARLMVPEKQEELPAWLGCAAPFYEEWDRQDLLNLSINWADEVYTVTIQPLADGELFLLSHTDKPTGTTLAVTAQVLRQPLTELFSLSQQLFGSLEEVEDPKLQSQTSAMTRHLYRLIRISANLADFEQMRSGQYLPQWRRLELNSYLTPLADSLAAVCAEADRTLEYKVPREQVQFFADSDLLERAILNLLSNAVKYGTTEQPIRFWAEVRPAVILFRIRNHCTTPASELLNAAFRRMEQRTTLPDPLWGLGMGLPLARHIAQLHGGTAALEVTEDGVVTVTLSISRRRPPQDALVKTPLPRDYTGGLQRTLVELSDVLPDDCYDSSML